MLGPWLKYEMQGNSRSMGERDTYVGKLLSAFQLIAIGKNILISANSECHKNAVYGQTNITVGNTTDKTVVGCT